MWWDSSEAVFFLGITAYNKVWKIIVYVLDAFLAIFYQCTHDNKLCLVRFLMILLRLKIKINCLGWLGKEYQIQDFAQYLMYSEPYGILPCQRYNWI